DRERGACQAFHVPQRVGGLGGPAPDAWRGGVGDGLQLAQCVRAAQSVRADAAVAVVGRPAVVHRDPGEGRQDPCGVHGLAARLGWTVISVNLPAEAECTQASLPATRNPVSSKCATGAAVSALRIASSVPPSFPEIRLTMPATAPSETATPNSSLT